MSILHLCPSFQFTYRSLPHFLEKSSLNLICRFFFPIPGTNLCFPFTIKSTQRRRITCTPWSTLRKTLNRSYKSRLLARKRFPSMQTSVKKQPSLVQRSYLKVESPIRRASSAIFTVIPSHALQIATWSSLGPL